MFILRETFSKRFVMAETFMETKESLLLILNIGKRYNLFSLKSYSFKKFCQKQNNTYLLALLLSKSFLNFVYNRVLIHDTLSLLQLIFCSIFMRRSKYFHDWKNKSIFCLFVFSNSSDQKANLLINTFDSILLSQFETKWNEMEWNGWQFFMFFNRLKTYLFKFPRNHS